MTHSSANSALLGFVDFIPACAVIRHGDQLFPNERTELLTGYSRQELNRLDVWMQRLHGEEWEAVLHQYEKDRMQGFPQPRMLRARTRSSGIRWIEFTANLGNGAEIWLLNDITGSKLEKEEQQGRLEQLEIRLNACTEELHRVVNMLLEKHQQCRTNKCDQR